MNDGLWVNAKDDFIIKRDEKIILRVYRFCKHHYEFFLGILFTIIIIYLVKGLIL